MNRELTIVGVDGYIVYARDFMGTTYYLNAELDPIWLSVSPDWREAWREVLWHIARNAVGADWRLSPVPLRSPWAMQDKLTRELGFDVLKCSFSEKA